MSDNHGPDTVQNLAIPLQYTLKMCADVHLQPRVMSCYRPSRDLTAPIHRTRETLSWLVGLELVGQPASHSSVTTPIVPRVYVLSLSCLVRLCFLGAENESMSGAEASGGVIFEVCVVYGSV